MHQILFYVWHCQAGEHAALAPVNNDVQADQIPSAYIEDTEDVALAKVFMMRTIVAAMILMTILIGMMNPEILKLVILINSIRE